jgi:Rhs element Vgr protein
MHDDDGLREQNKAASQTENAVTIETAATCELLVDGKTVRYEISEVDLRQRVDDHHVLRVKLLDIGQTEQGRDILQDLPHTGFLGKTLSVTLSPSVAGDGSGKLEFVGIVTEVSFENRVDGLNVTTVTAHSPTIGMDGAKRNMFYFDQSSSDVIKKVLSEHSITQGQIESTSGMSAYCVQYRETDYDFVMRLATGAGLFAYYNGKEFHVGKASSSGSAPVIWRETLGAFTIGLGTSQPEFNAQVYNYAQASNYAQDTKSVPPKASLSQLSKLSPDASKKVYKMSGFAETAKVVADARSLDDEVQRARSRSMSSMINCVGQSIEPKVAIGHCVKVEQMGALNNQYWITSVRHVLSGSGMYHNEFTCVPLDIAFPASRSRLEPATQIQSAIVTDNNDPEALGRLKVKFPWLESDETTWLRVSVPHAGDERGWFSMPEVGDEVLVGFEQGDPDHPVVLGSVYNSKAKPPGDAINSDNDVKLFCTRGGSQIMIDDKSGSEKLTITTKDGKNSIVLDVSGQKIAIESEGDISLKGKNLSLESDMEIKLKAGTNLKIEAGANLEAKATAQYKGEGAMMSLQGQSMVEVKGAMIKLN